MELGGRRKRQLGEGEEMEVGGGEEMELGGGGTPPQFEVLEIIGLWEVGWSYLSIVLPQHSVCSSG